MKSRYSGSEALEKGLAIDIFSDGFLKGGNKESVFTYQRTDL